MQMTARNFQAWLNTFRQSINSFSYYTDFEKVFRNVDRYKIELNLLNSLIGERDIECQFQKLMQKYPECLSVIPILLAVRSNEIFCRDTHQEKIYRFDKPTQSIDEYKYFMRETGLFDLIQNHVTRNLVDYVLGVEVGLDSNGRKNRGGHQMEDLVENFLKETRVEYRKEMNLTDIEKMWGIDLSAISAQGKTEKRFDFVAKTSSCIFGIETNFYTAGGSKLNETARSYKMIAEESQNITGFQFVWITDGDGWKSARNNLEETFQVLETLFNIQDLENGVLKNLFKDQGER